MTYPHNARDDEASRSRRVMADAEYAAWAERTLMPRNPTWSEWQAQIRRTPFRGRAKRSVAKDEPERPEQVDFFGRGGGVS